MEINKFKSTTLFCAMLSLYGCGGGTTTPDPLPEVEVEVEVEQANVIPTANAGVDQTVDEQAQVTLAGSGSDTDGSIVTYYWTQTSGNAVTLVDSDSASINFVAPSIVNDETLTFELTVTDDKGALATDSIDINIAAFATSPISDVVFADSELATCVTNASNANGWTLTDEVTTINCQDAQAIADLSGIEAFSRLTTFALNEYKWNSLSDISPLAELTELTHLSLTRAQINDISVLSGLTKLTDVNLSDNQITDISPLANLAQLRKLSLAEGGQLSDFSPLSNLSGLTDLNLTNMAQLVDLTPISGLTSLTRLILAHNNSLSHYEVLSNFSALTHLDLSYNNFNASSVLSIIENLTTLNYLNLDRNSFYDLSFLTHLSALTELSATGVGNLNITGLSELTAMKKLTLRGNAIGNISVLANLTALTHLDLGPDSMITSFGNKISDIGPLANLTALVELNLSLNLITNVSPLAGLTGLNKLNLGSNQLNDIEPLKSLVNATSINLYANDQISCAALSSLQATLGENIVIRPTPCRFTLNILIADLLFWDDNLKNCVVETANQQGWTTLADVTSLSCENLSISNLNGLEKFKNLKQLSLANNQIIEIDALFNLPVIDTIDLSGNNNLSCKRLDQLAQHIGSNGLTRPESCGGTILLSELTFADETLQICVNWSAGRNGWTLISEFTSLGCYDDPFRTNPKIFSLTGVEQLTALQDISLYTQGFTNISPFAALPNLQSLSLWRGSDSRQIADLSPLSMMTGLTHLSLSYQETSDLAAIGPLTALVYLKIIDAQLVDISAISTHTAMVNLDLRNNMIVDVSGLHNMVNADSINLSGNNGISCSALDALVGALGDSVVTRPWSCVTD